MLTNTTYSKNCISSLDNHKKEIPKTKYLNTTPIQCNCQIFLNIPRAVNMQTISFHFSAYSCFTRNILIIFLRPVRLPATTGLKNPEMTKDSLFLVVGKTRFCVFELS